MVTALILFFVAHFVSDFILQSRRMGKEKSEKRLVLFTHVSIIFMVTLGALSPILDIEVALLVCLLNAGIHALIDWNIWKIYKRYALKKIQKDAQEMASAYGFSDKWANGKPKTDDEIRKEKIRYFSHAANSFKYWEDHWFYVTIGLDQLLHAVTMIVLLGLFI